MLQQFISRKIGAFVDWSAYYITQRYHGLEQDHQTITLFKNILMNVDSIYFKQLLSQPISIRQLQITINQYFFEKLSQTKETVLQGGNVENTTIRILAMFQLTLELAYVTSKQQCLAAISELDDQSKDIIERTLNEILKEKRGRLPQSIENSSSSDNRTIKRLQEENQKLKAIIETLRANQYNLIEKNLELESRIRQIEYYSLRKDSQLQECNRKIFELESIFKQVSAELFPENNEKMANTEGKQEFKEPLNSPIISDIKPGSENSFKQQIQGMTKTIVGHSHQGNQQQNDDWLIQHLESQYRKSEQINHRFKLLRQMHHKLQSEVENILIN